MMGSCLKVLLRIADMRGLDLSFQIVSLNGFKIRMEWSAVIGWTTMAVIGANLMMFLYRTDYETALRFGLLFWMLHMGTVFIHVLGHVMSSALSGYPMTGVEFWWMFARTLYPADEPLLSPRQHIVRAIGGPLASAAWVVVLHQAIDRQTATDDFSVLLLQLAFLNALVYLLAPLIPFSFSDGGTIVANLRRQPRADSGG